MSEVMAINGKNLLSIREVVGRTKYTRDYIARLAREGTIVGVQVGRQWFIDEASLLSFASVSELESQVRRRQLSQERRREREATQALRSEWDVVTKKPRYAAGRAATYTVLLLVCGVMSGYALYALPTKLVSMAGALKAQSPLLALEPATSGVPTEDSPALAPLDEQPLSIVSTEAKRVMFTDSAEVRSIASSTGGILLLPAFGVASTAAEVAALFSDPVTVMFSEDGIGTVTLASGTASTSVQFVTVPVKVAQTAGGQNDNAVTP